MPMVVVDHLARVLLKNSKSPAFCWHYFKHLLSSPSPRITPPSVSVIARILAEARMLAELRHLHHLLVSLPPSHAVALHLSQLSLSSAKSCLLDFAMAQFHAVRSRFPALPPSIRLYNALLRCSLKENRSDLVSFLYEDLTVSRIAPDTFTFNILIASLCDLGCVDDARKLFDKMHVKSCKPNIFTFGILCRGYCRNGLISRGLELLDLMEGTGCLPNRVMYNTIIAGLCREGRVVEAQSVLERMGSGGIAPDVVTFNSRISALCAQGNVLGAAEILRDMEMGDGTDLPKPNSITYNLVLDGFSKLQRFEEVDNLVKSMKENGIFCGRESYNVWLCVLVRNGKLFEARSVLEEMMGKGIEPDIRSYNILISGLCQEGMFSDSRAVMTLMRDKGVIPDVFTYCTMLHWYCSKGKFGEANRIMDEMVQNGCTPNTVTCNILLNSLWKQGKAMEAERLLQKMAQRGYELNTVTCNTVINGLCKNGKMEKAVDIINGMWDHGSIVLGDLGHAFLGLVDSYKNSTRCSPDLLSYSTIITELCKVGWFDEAKRKFVEMKGRKLSPDSIVYDVFIHGFCKYGKLSSAFHVLRDMEKCCNLTSKSYNFLIQGLSKKDRIDEIYNLIAEMQEKGIPLDVFTYNNLIRCLCENGKAQEAASHLDEMLQAGVIPNVSTFCLLVEGFCKVCDFAAAKETLEISIKVLGQKDPVHAIMFNGLLEKGEVLKAREFLEVSLDRGIGLENFFYKILIQELCKENGLEDAINILNELINRDYIFDPAAIMPVIDELGRKGRKYEGDKLSEFMFEMADRRNKLKQFPSNLWDGKSMRHVMLCEQTEMASNIAGKRKHHLSIPDWHQILHRDDGSATAIKILRRVQRGWGQGSLLSIKPLKNDIVV